MSLGGGNDPGEWHYMCGIIGSVGENGARLNMQRALESMQHRGPDGSGEVALEGANNSVWFGHRRLAILDLSDAGAQPMWSDCGRYVITYNGEVYNSGELRAELEAAGRRFVSTCDTEVIVNGYAEWGDAIVTRLVGMFAFAVWDQEKEELFLARDRVGMKPLFYAATPAGITFASDANALRQIGSFDTLDPEALALFLVFGYVPSPFAIWRGMAKLPAAHCLTWRAKDGVVSCRAYWAPPDCIDGRVPGADEAEALIDEVVSDHLLSDVPVGVFLSGGLDSSLIASCAVRADSDAQLRALTVGFPGTQDDEMAIGATTAEAIGLKWEGFPLTSDMATARFGPSIATLDEPFSYSAIVTQFAVSGRAATKNKVMLSGDGGDEMFGGYRWYDNLDAQQKLRPNRFGRLSPRAMLERFSARSSRHRNLRRIAGAFAPEMAADIVANIKPSRVVALVDGLLDRYDAPGLPLKRRLQRIDLMTFCADCICTKIDRAGMAHSLEVRPPLLDHRIADFALSVPISPSYDGEPKAILRTILKRRGLGHLLTQPKRGFSFKGTDGLQSEGTISQLNRNAAMAVDWQAKLGRPSKFTAGQTRAIDYLGKWLDTVVT